MHFKDNLQRVSGEDLRHLYCGALAGDFQDEILDLVATRLPGVAVLFISQDTVEPSGNFLLHRGLDTDAVRSFSVDISADSVWFQKQWQQPVAAVFRQRDLIDSDDFKSTKFYRKWLSERGAFEDAIGTVFIREGTRQIALEIRFAERDASEIAPLAKHLLAELAPHLENAAHTANLKSRKDEAEREAAQILNLIPFPAAIVDPECRLENMNAQAERMLHLGDAIFLGADERLHGIEAEADASLRAAVQEIGTGSAHDATWVRFEPTGRQCGLLMTLVHLDPIYPVRRGRDAMGRVPGNRRIAIIAHRADEKLKLSHDMLWQTFGLTTKESELASALLHGQSIGDIACKKRLSKQTLRNQLGSVMRKTGTHRQVDLVATLMMLSLSSPA